MARDIKNVAASVRQQLQNRAHDKRRPFNELPQHYTLERFLYRLAQSAYADRFVLKGALRMPPLACNASHYQHAEVDPSPGTGFEFSPRSGISPQRIPPTGGELCGGDQIDCRVCVVAPNLQVATIEGGAFCGCQDRTSGDRQVTETGRQEWGRGLAEKAKAFYIGPFSQAHDSFFTVAQRAVRNLPLARRPDFKNGSLLLEPDLLRADDDRRSPEVLNQILWSIRSAPFVLVNLSPDGSQRTPRWNPNVLFEYAVAREWEVPRFLLLPKVYEPLLPKLPFDLKSASVTLAEPDPHVFENQFLEWLTANHHAIARSKLFRSYIAEHQSILRILSSVWGGNSLISRSVLKAYTSRLRSIATTVAEVARGSRSVADVDFDVGKQVLSEDLFVYALDSLTAGDCYETLSTYAFWRSLGSVRGRFFQANRTALNRGVAIRRVFLVDDDADDEEVRSSHERLASKFQKHYSLRFIRRSDLCLLRLEDSKALRPEEDGRHSGILTYKSRQGIEQVVAFTPKYSGERLTGFILQGNARDRRSELREMIKAVENNTPADQLRRLAGSPSVVPLLAEALVKQGVPVNVQTVRKALQAALDQVGGDPQANGHAGEPG